MKNNQTGFKNMTYCFFFWTLAITTTCVCMLLIVGGHVGDRDSLVNYQEECVQSHIEDTGVYIYENKYVNSTREFVPHNNKVISIHREMKKVCDKYALVRYADD